MGVSEFDRELFKLMQRLDQDHGVGVLQGAGGNSDTNVPCDSQNQCVFGPPTHKWQRLWKKSSKRRQTTRSCVMASVLTMRSLFVHQVIGDWLCRHIDMVYMIRWFKWKGDSRATDIRRFRFFDWWTQGTNRKKNLLIFHSIIILLFNYLFH